MGSPSGEGEGELNFIDNHVATIRANHMMAALFDLAEIAGYTLLCLVSWKALVGVMLVVWTVRGRMIIS